MTRQSSAKESRPDETRSGAAPTHTPMSFHADPGPCAAATTLPSLFVHVASSAMGAMTSASTRPLATIESVTRRPTIAPAATVPAVVELDLEGRERIRPPR